MTLQISDTVRYLDTSWSLVGVSGAGLFDPARHGVEVAGRCTNCRRGFHCSYEVVDGRLELTRVDMWLSRDHAAMADRGEGPVLFGRVPQRSTEYRRVVNPSTGEERMFLPGAEFVMIDLRELVPFSGGLLLGDGFLRELYDQRGNECPERFRDVHELLFEAGCLTAVHDRSGSMAEFRTMQASRPANQEFMAKWNECERWIDRSLSRRYACLFK